MSSEQRRDGKNNCEDRFRFVPFSKQPTYPTFEEQLKKPKVHNIRFDIDFFGISFPDLEGESCEHCGKPFQRVAKDFEKRWGDTEQLKYIIPNTPQIVCGCKLFTLLEDAVYRRMTPAFKAIRVTLDVIEFQEDRDLATLKSLLPDEDYLKVIDFVDNFWVPKDSPMALIRKKRKQKLA